MPSLRISPPCTVLLLGLAGSCFLPAPASSGAEAASASGPRVFLGDVRADTLQATPAEILPAAERSLTKDHWVISPSSTGSRLVTEWKEFRHPLARLLAGKLRARCVVDIRALDERLTIVRFQGGIASAQSGMQENAIFAVAQSSYRGAVQDFYDGLQASIAEQRNASSSEFSGPLRVP
jgi:hypothetical protein